MQTSYKNYLVIIHLWHLTGTRAFSFIFYFVVCCLFGFFVFFFLLTNAVYINSQNAYIVLVVSYIHISEMASETLLNLVAKPNCLLFLCLHNQRRIQAAIQTLPMISNKAICTVHTLSLDTWIVSEKISILFNLQFTY